MKELETGEMLYKTMEEFLTALKKEFGGRIKEVGARREDNGRIHARVQEGSKGKRI